jgi:bis(5'-nucleosidyl)-tetraphosphatase
VRGIITAMSKPVAELTDESFGVVPILRKGEQTLFLLIQHNAGHWAFPKGHAERGESDIEAARRELCEETGIASATLDESNVFEERYTKTWRGDARRLVRKTVRYYIGEVDSPRVQVQEAEIQNHKWVTIDEARKLITYSESRRLLEEVAKHLKLI